MNTVRGNVESLLAGVLRMNEKDYIMDRNLIVNVYKVVFLLMLKVAVLLF